MAATEISTPNASTPSYTPSISVDYNNQNENIFTMFRGYNSLSLTNWASGNTTVPQVAANSVLEIGGVLYEFPIAEAISTGSASSGTVYVVFDASAKTLYMTNTAPTWSVPYNGWYDATVTDRYTGHIMEWDGSTAYNEKAELLRNNQTGNLIGLNVDGYIYTVGEGLADPPLNSVTPSAAYTFPAGFIQITSVSGTSRPMTLDIYGSTAWTTFYSGTVASTLEFPQFWSNGNNVRFTVSVYDTTINYVVYSA